jgi:leucyl aminopeptidase
VNGETLQARSAVAEVDVADATLIAGVMEGLEPVTGSEEVFETVDQAILAAAGFEGKPGQTLTLPHSEAKALLLAGLGEEASFESIRTAAGNAIRGVKTERAVNLLARVDVDEATRAVVEGSLLGGYQFRAYKTDDNGSDAEIVDIVGADEDELSEAILACEATILARDWVNTPARDKSPETLAELIVAATEGTGIVSEIWDRPRIEEEKLGALLGVAAGSDRDPRVVILQYRPDGATSHLALVGKGIVFDTGGLSLKTANYMEEMKDDMAGAAAVTAAAVGIARLGLLLDITVIAPLTDNAVGGDATRPGDVLRPVDGPTIEVLNTDAEGRLILADGLGLAKRYEPDLTIDVATLTGAAAVALGKQVAAVFGSDPDVSKSILEAASHAGEEFWELPLFDGYRKSIDSNVADIKNISGSRYGGAIVAALFLKEYAGDGPWAHLDIAGPARSDETTGQFVKGASGVGVRTLIELARSLAEAD